MIEWLKRQLKPPMLKEREELAKKTTRLFAQINALEAGLQQMHREFSVGGTITWEQLQEYKVATAENPIGYPTGKNCLSFRLPDVNGAMVFRTVCIAPPGETGSFGWHGHPSSYEMNVQIHGEGRHNGEDLPPYSVTLFPPGMKHDYELPPGGSLLTFFTRNAAP